MKTTIQTPLSGEMRYVGIHLPREVFDFVKVEAESSAATLAATLRGMMIEHLKSIGVMSSAKPEDRK